MDDPLLFRDEVLELGERERFLPDRHAPGIREQVIQLQVGGKVARLRPGGEHEPGLQDITKLLRQLDLDAHPGKDRARVLEEETQPFGIEGHGFFRRQEPEFLEVGRKYGGQPERFDRGKSRCGFHEFADLVAPPHPNRKDIGFRSLPPCAADHERVPEFSALEGKRGEPGIDGAGKGSLGETGHADDLPAEEQGNRRPRRSLRIPGHEAEGNNVVGENPGGEQDRGRGPVVAGQHG